MSDQEDIALRAMARLVFFAGENANKVLVENNYPPDLPEGLTLETLGSPEESDLPIEVFNAYYVLLQGEQVVLAMERGCAGRSAVATMGFSVALQKSDSGKLIESVFSELQRSDAMSVEIDNVLHVLQEEDKRPPKTAQVWRELTNRCGKEGSCCATIETKPGTDKPAIVWFGVQGNQEFLDYKSLQKRLDRRKKRR